VFTSKHDGADARTKLQTPNCVLGVSKSVGKRKVFVNLHETPIGW
jgi:hypothetical protein